MTTDLFPEQKQQKVYKNGLTYSQNVQAGNFIPKVAMQNHKDLCQRIDKLEEMLVKAIEKLSS